MDTHHRTFVIGCAVWAYKAWIGTFFPAGSASGDLLRLYSKRLTTVEGNTTFYAIPKPEMVQRWASETPTDFQFCCKLPRDISHRGALVQQHAPTRAFVERMAGLGSRLGPFFLQLPPAYSPHQMDDLAQWLEGWAIDLPTYRVAVEVRHPAWYKPPAEAALMELLARYGAGRVLMDVRPLQAGPLPGAEEDLQRARDNKPDVPLHPLHSSGFSLVRYIAHPDLPLNDPLLDEWAERLALWLRDGVQVYWFMHCPDESRSPELCRALYRRLARLIDLPPLPWDDIDGARMEQQRLF